MMPRLDDEARVLNQMSTIHLSSAGAELPARDRLAIGRAPVLMTAFVVGFCAAFGRLGADCLWLVALGDHILDARGIPQGVPFAAAPTRDWPNVVVAAEVIFALVHRMGSAALLVMQLACTAAMLFLIALGARRLGARSDATGLVLGMLAAGMITTLVIVRLQVLSLIPFALLLLLLRAEHQRPSWRIWLLVPLFTIWTNLHGAVLMGVAVAGCYLLLSRLGHDPKVAISVGVCSIFALWATPAGLRTSSYYLGVLENEAARRGTDLWARPDMSNVFDLILAVVGTCFLILFLRRRRPLWEYLALVGLAAGTVMAARHGPWLLLFAAGPAAAHIAGGEQQALERPRLVRTVIVGVIAAGIAGGLVYQRGPTILPPGTAVVPSVAGVVAGRPVLAPEPIAESLAVAGVPVWVSNPLDAFKRADQAAYLDFLAGGAGARRALNAVDIVLVPAPSRSASVVRADPSFERTHVVGEWEIYQRK
jgi:hypothetical protein